MEEEFLFFHMSSFNSFDSLHGIITKFVCFTGVLGKNNSQANHRSARIFHFLLLVNRVCKSGGSFYGFFRTVLTKFWQKRPREERLREEIIMITSYFPKPFVNAKICLRYTFFCTYVWLASHYIDKCFEEN